jgi:SAM-dependent methyltransferase
MLQNTKAYVEKIQQDLNLPFKLDDEIADVILALFVVIHIDDLQVFFENTYRILKQDGVFVFFHHIENRNYKYEE